MGVPDGSLVLQLNQDAQVIAGSGGFVSAAEQLIFQFDATGNLVSGSQTYSNAELNPQANGVFGTYYLVAIYDANGARLNSAATYWQFTESAGSTVNISSMAPYVP